MSQKLMFGTDPLFVSLRSLRGPTKPRGPKATMDADPDLKTFFYPCRFDDKTRTVTYKPASGDDLESISKFVDFWLTGGAKRLGIPGGGKDYFVPKGQQITYLKYKTTYLATYEEKIVGWSVKSKNKTMIHLLVCPEYRGRGVGGHLLEILDPAFIRSKSDQSTGNPLAFYQKHGYEVVEAKTGKHKNIDIMQRPEKTAKNPVTPTIANKTHPRDI